MTQQTLTKYSQNWTAYNMAQQNEKSLFLELLDSLLEYLPEEQKIGIGRPKKRFRDMVFCLCLYVYCGKSSRRTISELKTNDNYIKKPPHFNTLLNYLNKPIFYEILQHLITVSCLPLKQVELDFTVDASGFSANEYQRWLDYKWGGYKNKRNWVKAHVFSGTRTNIITAVEVTESTVGDTTMFPKLLESTGKNFNRMDGISADKAYSSSKNLELIYRYGGIPFIPFKSNITGKRTGSKFRAWRRAFEFFQKHREVFEFHYHRRSNAETIFSMMKKKFSPRVRTRNLIGQKNELLVMALCHNLCVLVQEMHELKIDINFKLCSEQSKLTN